MIHFNQVCTFEWNGHCQKEQQWTTVRKLKARLSAEATMVQSPLIQKHKLHISYVECYMSHPLQRKIYSVRYIIEQLIISWYFRKLSLVTHQFLGSMSSYVILSTIVWSSVIWLNCLFEILHQWIFQIRYCKHKLHHSDITPSSICLFFLPMTPLHQKKYTLIY